MKIHRLTGTRARLAFLTSLLLAGAGCGNLTVGGFGNATVVVSGDAAEPTPGLASASVIAPVPSAAPRGVPAAGSLLAATSAPALSSHDDEPEGEIEVDFVLYLVSETGGQTRLGQDDIEVRVDLQGRTEVDAVEEQVPVARYTELQIVFTKIQAEVDSGLIINGVPVTGEIRVEFDNLTLLVPVPIDIDITAGSSVELVLDLNAPAWLQAVDPVTATVDPSVFASLITVVQR